MLTMDGVGEWATTSLALGTGNPLEVQGDPLPAFAGPAVLGIHLLHRLQGQLGRVQGDGPGPLRGAAYVQQIYDHLIDLKADGTFRLNLDYFDYCTGLTMTNERFDALFGGPPRKPEERLTQREMDLAASMQAVTEEVVLRLTRRSPGKPAAAICASPAASRSTAWPTARCCATARSRTSGSSRRPATRAARSARRSPPITCTRASRERR